MTPGLLVRIETLKASKRSGIVLFTVAVVMVALVMVLPDYIIAKHRNQPVTVVFPHVWTLLVRGPSGVITMMLASIVVVLVVAGEFMWRTARQNIIDGLSKNEWFTGKLLITITVCLVFTFLLFATGAGVAALSPTDDIIRWQDVRMFGGYLLAIFGYAAAAFALSIIVRKDGAALGFFLVLQGFVEPIITVVLERIHKGWGAIINYLPMHVILSNIDPRYWDANYARRVAVVAGGAGEAMSYPGAGLNAAMTVGYILLFVALSYWSFRRRDL